MKWQQLWVGPWIYLHTDDTIPSQTAASTPQLSCTSVEHFFDNLHLSSNKLALKTSLGALDTRPPDFIHVQQAQKA